ncbi:PDZ domain-containing protein [Alteromonadaceae bacterium BrNp21-10]|nr:PDZ domain-containing protein [Alteromonadaceae bacterium BrNp21-10]
MRHLTQLYPTFKLLFVVLTCIVSTQANARDDDTKVINAVVNIHVNQVRAWDDSYNNSSEGTGFVIDAEQGLILTNKHIVESGPVVAYAEFANKKQIELIAIYRDPVHDFGLFKYDPKDLEDFDLSAIPLATTAAIGTPIRLYGNDGGENLSIIQGVLSRIDRPAPNYGNTNTDFNTFYYQAALGSSGGSSGSPILNEAGQAIAINAGSRRDTETAFFLPMDMIIPTIRKIQQQLTVARGTLQTEFTHTAFNRLRTLGLPDELIRQALKASPSATGKLLVSHVILKGPADNILQPGDILLSINGQAIDNFLQLETLLNSQVSQTVNVQMFRNGSLFEHDIKVDDLFALTPNEYIEYGKASIIPVGINLARLFNIAVEGVTLVDPGPLFGSQNIERFALIEEINNNPIKTLGDIEQQLSKVAVGEKFSVRYRYPFDIAQQQYKQLTDYTDWFDNKHCQEMIGERHWACTPLIKKATANGKHHFQSKQKVTSPLVDIDVFRPVLVNSRNDVTRQGIGAIIDDKAGYIITDKYLIDSSLVVIDITFNNGMTTKGQVVAIHPYLNLALIKADLSSVSFAKNTLLKRGVASIDTEQPYQLLSKSSMQDFKIAASADWPSSFNNGIYHDSFSFSPAPPDFGIYLNKQRQLAAINTTYRYKDDYYDDVISANLVDSFVQAAKQQQQGLYQVESSFNYIRYVDALELGIEGIPVANTERVINVQSVEALEGAELMPGDIVLAVNSQQIATVNELYQRIVKPEVNMDILRNGKQIQVSVKTKFKDFNPFHDVLFWGGAVIHKINEKIYLPEGLVDGCLRLSVFYYGSPIHGSGINGSHCIYSLDGKKVTTIDDVKNIIKLKESGDYTKVQVIELNNNFRIAEYRLREDPFYWPREHWRLQDQQWKKLIN